MRRAMLLALFALALSTTALTQQFRFNTGTPATNCTGTCASFTTSFPTNFSASIFCPSCNAVVNQISPVGMILKIPDLTCAGGFCDFNSGTVTVESLTDAFLFRDSLLPGFFIQTSGGGFLMPASQELAPIPPFVSSASLGFSITLDNGQLLAANGAIVGSGTVPPIPEPGTLWLLGTGMVGLAGLIRRKLS